MTWSIVAHDPATGAFAVAVSTCALAVGASCPFVRAGVGAVSTQSMTNRYLGPAVLDGLARGLAPAAAIEGALAGDEGRHLRQVQPFERQHRDVNDCQVPERRTLRRPADLGRVGYPRAGCLCRRVDCA